VRPAAHTLSFGAEACGCVWIFCETCGHSREPILHKLSVAEDEVRCAGHQHQKRSGVGRPLDRVLAPLILRRRQPREGADGKWTALCPSDLPPADLNAHYADWQAAEPYVEPSSENRSAADFSAERDPQALANPPGKASLPSEVGLRTGLRDRSMDRSMGIGGNQAVAERSPAREKSAAAEREIDETRARAVALGLDFERGSRCVIPGHDHDAALYWTGGHWDYRCKRCTLGLAELRAAIAYGDVRRLSVAEAHRWRQRLDYEAGLLKAVLVVIPLPDDASPAGRRHGAGIELYLGTRAAGGGKRPDEPFTFARDFRIAWCWDPRGMEPRMTPDQAKHGMGELAQLGRVERDGKRGRVTVWRLGSACRAELAVEVGIGQTVPGDA
jgi:hypothetical protein